MSTNWEVVPHTGERVLRNTIDGRIIEFTDDPIAPHQEEPMLGIAGMFSEEDIDMLLQKYSPYDLASGGA